MGFFRRKDIPEGKTLADLRKLQFSSRFGIAPDVDELATATSAEGTTIRTDEAIEVGG